MSTEGDMNFPKIKAGNKLCFLLARIFGKRIYGWDYGYEDDVGCHITAYVWRKHIYLWDEKIYGEWGEI
jgi:hypothetical protein